MLPGSRRQLVAGAVAGPGRFGFERLDAADGQLLELGAAVAVMRDRGVVDAEDALVGQRADDHRNRIAVEQQPERGLALLQLGDVDAQADDAAVLGQPFLDQDAAAVGQDLLVALAGLIEPGQPLGDPLFLAADRFGIVAALDADPDGILQPRSRLEQVRAAAVDLGIFLVPENISALGVEEHDALRQDVDRLAQPFVGFSRLRDRGFGLRALAHDLADFRRYARRLLLPSFGLGLAGRPGIRLIATCFDFFYFLWPATRHYDAHSLSAAIVLR